VRAEAARAAAALVLVLASGLGASGGGHAATERASETTSSVAASACTVEPAPALDPLCAPEHGVVVLAAVDAPGGRTTPARIEVLDASGGSWIAPGALPVGGDCRGHATVPSADEIARADPLLGTAPFVRNVQDRSYQFYLAGEAPLALPPGRYRVRAVKGIERTPAVRQVTVEPGRVAPVELPLARWIDMPALGWFSADDHLHVPRPGGDDDLRIARWMQAEDVHVANLLQMDIVPGVVASAQHDFGLAGVFRDGDTLIASGQENPRTWILGHGIILGAASYVDVPGAPLPYQPYWDAAARDGALRGYAHWGSGAARDGLALDAPAGNVEFLEVLQADLGHYDVLHEILGLGFRMTPTAGTDYPCALAGLPGRDRFYAHLEGPLTYRAWLEAIRHGRTFVTNGPLLTDFRAGDARTGDTLALDRPATVRVQGTVRFDPARDDVAALELLVNGQVVHAARERSAPDTIALATEVTIAGGAWLALRASGRKVDLPPFARPRAASAHSGAIWASVAGGAPITGSDEAHRLAIAEIGRLDRLAARLERDAKIGPPAWSGATRDQVARALPALRDAIDAARRRFEAILRDETPVTAR